MRALDAGLATGFARVALANVTREYPHKLDHFLDSPPGDLAPRALHPAFHGSYDWHSAVHMHWLLVRLLRLHPGLPHAAQITAVLDLHLAAEPLAVELAYFDPPGRRTFERPYGWAWLLELRAEALRLGETRGAAGLRWAQALEPLANMLAARLRAFLAIAAYPIRNGMHANTAFACILALDYARTAGDAALAEDIGRAARKWYLADRDAPLAYEPSLADFLSPSLVEAQLMREVLPCAEFLAWFRAYLPRAYLPRGLGSLAEPPVVPDRSDAQFSHLDGLSLSRAWALRRIATALPAGGAGDELTAVAERLFNASLPQVVGGDYVGEHWLASFAALALGDLP